MRQLLVFGDKTFKITVPDDAKITFGPFSPPRKNGQQFDIDRAQGTLRVYRGTEKDVLACFAGVRGFRDLSLQYAEEVAKEEGAVIWKSDERGYQREEKSASQKQWVGDPVALPPPPEPKKKGKR